MGTVIRIFFEYFSVVMFVAAVALAAALAKPKWESPNGFAEQALRWILLLSVGAQGVFTFVVHVFFPALSAANIGWDESPFQYEVGIADLTVGVLGIIAFWGNFSFRVAAAIAAIVWYGGDAIGHVRQMIVAQNYAPGNAGPWFWTDVLVPIVLAACVIVVWRRRKANWL